MLTSTKYTHTISIIMFHLIIILKHSTLASLKHKRLMRIFGRQPTALDGARGAPFPPARHPIFTFINN